MTSAPLRVVVVFGTRRYDVGGKGGWQLTLSDLVVGDRFVTGNIVARKDALDFRLGSDDGVVLLELVRVGHVEENLAGGFGVRAEGRKS